MVKVNPLLVGRLSGVSLLTRRSTSCLLRPSPCAMSRSGRTGTGSAKTTSAWTGGNASPAQPGGMSSRHAPVQSRVMPLRRANCGSSSVDSTRPGSLTW